METLDKERLARIEERQQYTNEQLDKLYKTLMGNGQPGILARNSSRISALEDKVATAIGCGLALTVISVVVGIVKAVWG